MTDEETFARVFGRTDWAVMFILARQGQSYARLRFHVGPGGDLDLPVCVDYTRPFAASDHAAWKQQYATCVEAIDPLFLAECDPRLRPGALSLLEPWDDEDWFLGWAKHPVADQGTANEATEAHHAL
jgi:hypothetical protein